MDKTHLPYPCHVATTGLLSLLGVVISPRWTSRRITRRLLILVMSLTWASGGIGEWIHQVAYRHVICAQHGVLEHIESARDSEHDTHPSIVQAASEFHEHGKACGFPLLPTAILPLPTNIRWRFESIGLSAPIPLVEAGAPRGPPLTYAPKTSPPIIG